MSPSDGTIRPFLCRSAALHGGLALGLLLLARRPPPPAAEVYRIDFVGPSNVILGRNPEPAAGAAAKPAPTRAARPAPQSQRNEFAARRRAPLPRPSILSSPQAPKESSPPAPENPPAAGPEGGEAAVSADMPNFPYPWYISQIRAALWSQWSARMPGGGGEATIEFTILKDGAAVDLRVESSSGESSFDFVALGAVQAGLPFPPLPGGYPERFLKVHVRFKSQ